MNWNPDARDPWPARRYLEAPPRSSWWLVGAALGLLALVALLNAVTVQ